MQVNYVRQTMWQGGFQKQRKQLVCIFKWISTKNIGLLFQKLLFFRIKLKAHEKTNRTDHMMGTRGIILFPAERVGREEEPKIG